MFIIIIVLRKYLLFLFLIPTVNSCQVLKNTANKAKAITQCKFELIDVHKKISFTEKTNNLWNYVITLDIAGTNPTVENITLGEYRLDLYANDKWIANIATKTPIALKPNSKTQIEAKTIISPNGALSIFLKKLFDKPIEYKVQGTFYLNLNGFVFPLELQLFKYVENPNK